MRNLAKKPEPCQYQPVDGVRCPDDSEILFILVKRNNPDIIDIVFHCKNHQLTIHQIFEKEYNMLFCGSYGK